MPYNREVYKAWEARNKERLKAQRAAWYQQTKEANPVHHMYNSIKSKSVKYQIPFDIDKEDIIVPDNCPICGIKLQSSKVAKNKASPSLDKIIPSLGYVKGNVAVICDNCNRQKGDNTVESLQQILTYVLSKDSQ